jgi:hypothetical protein
MSLQPLPSTERIVATRQAPENAERVTSQITQDGSIVHLQLDSDCQIQTYNRVETIQHSTTVNKGAWGDWAFGISGAAFAGLGVWGLADSSKTYSNDTTSRTYNPVGKGAEQGLAVASLIAGGVLAGIAVVDVVRAQHDEDRSPTYAERRGALAGTCPSRPVAAASISGAFAKGSTTPIPLGSTDSAGSLDIELAAHPPPMPSMPSGDFTGEPYGESLTISSNGTDVGTVPLSAAYPSWRLAWKQAAASGAAAAKALMDQGKREYQEEQLGQQRLAQERENATLDQIDSDFTKLEKTKRWGDDESALFVRASKAISGIVNAQTAANEAKLSPRAAALWDRCKRLLQSPAFKQRVAEIKTAEAAEAAYRNSPQGRAEASEARAERAQSDRREDCEHACPQCGSDNDCTTRQFCVAQCKK